MIMVVGFGSSTAQAGSSWSFGINMGPGYGCPSYGFSYYRGHIPRHRHYRGYYHAYPRPYYYPAPHYYGPGFSFRYHHR